MCIRDRAYTYSRRITPCGLFLLPFCFPGCMSGTSPWRTQCLTVLFRWSYNFSPQTATIYLRMRWSGVLSHCLPGRAPPLMPVSYTHLDVYKRQVKWMLMFVRVQNKSIKPVISYDVIFSYVLSAVIKFVV